MARSILFALIGLLIVLGSTLFISSIYTVSPEMWGWKVRYWPACLVGLLGAMIFLINIASLRKVALSIICIALINPFSVMAIFAGLIWMQLNKLEHAFEENKITVNAAYVGDEEVKVGRLRVSSGTNKPIYHDVVYFEYEVNSEKYIGYSERTDYEGLPFDNIWVLQNQPTRYVRENYDFKVPYKYKIPFFIGLLVTLFLLIVVIRTKDRLRKY